MAEERTVNDPIFGELRHVAGDLWERPIEVDFLGSVWTVPLMIDIDPTSGVEEHQLTAYKVFRREADRVLREAEMALFRYYQSVCNEYRSRYGIVDPNDASVPIVHSQTDMFRLVKPEGITFPYARARPTFGILCQCSWEEERGVAVKYENGRVVDVGFQDIVL